MNVDLLWAAAVVAAGVATLFTSWRKVNSKPTDSRQVGYRSVAVGATQLAIARAHNNAIEPNRIEPIRASTDGGSSLIRCAATCACVPKGQPLDPPLFRAGIASAGATIADIQDVLGHESDKMARHYAGGARTLAAAGLMTKYGLSG